MCSDYGWFLNIHGQSFTGFRIYLRLLMPELRIGQGCKYASVTKGTEYARMSLNIPLKYLNMCEYALIMLNMLQYA